MCVYLFPLVYEIEADPIPFFELEIVYVTYRKTIHQPHLPTLIANRAMGSQEDEPEETSQA